MPATLEVSTDRLIGRPVRLEDLTDWQNLNFDPRVSASLQGPTEEGELNQFIRHWEKYAYGLWTFRHKDGSFVGYAGTTHTYLDGKEDAQLRCAVLPKYWGQNYGTEMSSAGVKFVFEEKRLSEIIGVTSPTNVGSRRMMEKCGFRCEEHGMIWGSDQVLYRIVAGSSHTD